MLLRLGHQYHSIVCLFCFFLFCVCVDVFFFYASSVSQMPVRLSLFVCMSLDHSLADILGCIHFFLFFFLVSLYATNILDSMYVIIQ
jgi:hypothetical protein